MGIAPVRVQVPPRVHLIFETLAELCLARVCILVDGLVDRLIGGKMSIWVLRFGQSNYIFELLCTV